MARATTSHSSVRLVSLVFLALAALWLLTGCRLSAPQPALPTGLAPTAATVSPTNTPEGDLLPSAVFFLRQDAQGLPQVWRLSTNGQALLQLTYSAAPVRDFDISASGRLAYVAAGSLIVKYLDGSPPETWVAAMDDQPASYPHAPRWSPDGKTLAYSAWGLWLRQGDQSRMLYQDPSDGTRRTIPYSWSPDGQWLLVSQDQPDGTTLAIIEIDTGLLIPLSYAPLCCQAAWTPDSQGLFVANPYPQHGPSGLWWASIKNLAAPLLPWQAADGTYNVVGWPHVNQSGLLGYAFANYPAAPPDMFPFGLYTASVSSPTHRQPLRLETYFVREILWMPEGRSALVVIPPPGAINSQVSGPVVLITSGDQPGVVLCDSGYNLKWGP